MFLLRAFQMWDWFSYFLWYLGDKFPTVMNMLKILEQCCEGGRGGESMPGRQFVLALSCPWRCELLSLSHWATVLTERRWRLDIPHVFGRPNLKNLNLL